MHSHNHRASIRTAPRTKVETRWHWMGRRAPTSGTSLRDNNPHAILSVPTSTDVRRLCCHYPSTFATHGRRCCTTSA